MDYDVIIIGAGPGGIFSAYEIAHKRPELKTVEVDEKLQSRYKGLYITGDGSGITHSLSHASASGVHVAQNIIKSI